MCAPALLYAGGSRDDWGFGLPKIGNGRMVTSEKSISPFWSIQIEGSAIVNFHVSQDFRAVVTVDSNLEEYTRVYTQNQVLNIGTKKRGNYQFTNYTVDVYAPRFEGLSISGAARFEGMDKITISSFKLNISGLGKIEGSFECNSFSTSISGSGNINIYVISHDFNASVSGAADIALAGSTKEMNISVLGSGDLNGTEFVTQNADVQISGSGKIDIWVLENLKVNISGAGRVRYRGSPKVDYTGSGSGRLESI